MIEKLIKNDRIEEAKNLEKEKIIKKEENNNFDLNIKTEEKKKSEEKTNKEMANLKVNKKRNISFFNNSKKNYPNNNNKNNDNNSNNINNINNINSNNNKNNDKINIVIIPLTYHKNYNVLNKKKDFFNQRDLRILYEDFFNSENNLKLFRNNNEYLKDTNNIKIFVNINNIKHKELEKLKKLLKSYITNKFIFAFEEYKCNICLGEFSTSNDAFYLPCLHKFHKLCILNWIYKNSICPICKYSMCIY